MILAIIMSLPLTFPVLVPLPNCYKRFSSEGKTDLSEGKGPPSEDDRNNAIFKLNLHGYSSLFRHAVSSTSF